MATAPRTDWRKDLGVEGRRPPNLFFSKDELRQSIPQAHLLRRAFDLLGLDAILCTDSSPLAYFKCLRRATPGALRELHRRFWNHGGAPILVIVSDEQVHIYSGMARPGSDAGVGSESPGLVDTLDRLAPRVRELLTVIESGDFFRQHQRSFDPAQRVDRDLLENLSDARAKLKATSRPDCSTHVLDALLCRLVFTCYLFDRKVIDEGYLRKLGVRGAAHLREVLSIRPHADARAALYRLFKGLAADFNGDLFSDDLDAESALILDQQIQTLGDFFHGTVLRTGQRAFWPYDFGIIPIETISAIYEQFLGSDSESVGAFYTPRFLAEMVLDVALKGSLSLIGRRFFDPACGSGIFLVGLFNRIAEEWREANPKARNDRKAKELMRLLCESLFGVDKSRTACRITAFSLYLAYLDQLSRRDIQELQEKGRALPPLIASGHRASGAASQGNIHHGDFFDEDVPSPSDVSLVIGNPPWGSVAAEDSPAGRWCARHDRSLPDKQIAAAFIWKAPHHAAAGGRVCLVLPHGVLFNHSTTAVPFQEAWARAHAVDLVLNLSDFQRFLFEEAEHPAVVVRYRSSRPEGAGHRIEYWAPKADWTATRAEIITIAPQDRTSFTVGNWLQDLGEEDAPQIWKQHFWATARDRRLLDRLSSYPRLRDHTRGPRERSETKRWLMGVGFQPVGESDDPSRATRLELTSKHFIAASNRTLNLFILPSDCSEIEGTSVVVRSGSNKNTTPFQAPHVLVAKGFTRVAYADFDVSFQDALRGIHGPVEDRDLLVFLAAYLRTPLARYYMFHTSSSWGVSRQEMHVEEMLRLPFPLPDQQPDPARCRQIIGEVTRVVDDAARQADAALVDRAGVVRTASAAIEPLVEEYFAIVPKEKLLIQDTNKVIIPSVRPTRARPLVPTIMPADGTQREAYAERVCQMLNDWAKRGRFAVRARVRGSESLGIGLAVFEKVERAAAETPMGDVGPDLLDALDHVRKAIPKRYGTLVPVRGVMVFERNRLYIVKPIGQRHWTQTAAMNDADEIAGTILMSGEGA